MNTLEKINKNLELLPPYLKEEVLNFIELLLLNARQPPDVHKEKGWGILIAPGSDAGHGR